MSPRDPHDDIRDLLDAAAPDGPDLPTAARARAVRGRARAARRRTGLVLVAAVVAVVGIGAGVAVLGSGDDPSTGRDQVAADPGPTSPSDASSTDAPTVECPDTPAVIDDQGRATTADLPTGASSLRLCPATFPTQEGSTEFTLLTAPLTDDVDVVLDRVRAQPVFVFPEECMSMSLAPMPWTMVVGYPDGSTVSVGATLTGCASVTIDGREVDVESTLGIVQDAILAEADQGTVASAEASASAAAAEATCPTLQGNGSTDSIQYRVADPDTIDVEIASTTVDSAAVCYGIDPVAGPAYAETEGALDEESIATVVADLRADTTAEKRLAGRCPDNPPGLVVVLDSVGGQASLTENPCTGEYTYADGFWVPSPQSQAVLEDALGGRVDR